MPNTTPSIKVKKVKEFGGKYIKVKLIGDSYDDCYKQALAYCKKNNKTFIHPFDDNKVIEGQATLAYEIFQELSDTIDYMFIPNRRRRFNFRFYFCISSNCHQKQKLLVLNPLVLHQWMFQLRIIN